MKAYSPVRHEDLIRDYLAENLQLLEPGLTLIQTEFPLKNAIGSDGFVDILARDRFGLTVVIELKRSNEAARQAVHEVCKYTALLRNQLGLSLERVRCIIASTEWHELLIPFSEFVSMANYSVLGLRLEAKPNGEVTSVSKVNSAPSGQDLQFSRQGWVVFFEDEAQRESTRNTRQAAFTNAGITDFVLLSLDRKHPREHYPTFIEYHAFGTISAGQVASLVERLTYLASDIADEDCEYVLGEVLSAPIAEVTRLGVDGEILYPEKCSTILDDFSVNQIVRSGRFVDAATVFTDTDLVKALTGVEGSSAFTHLRFLSPSHRLMWRTTVDSVDSILNGNDRWRMALQSFLDQSARAGADLVIVALHYPANILFLLDDMFAGRASHTNLPMLEATASSSDGSVTGLVGYVEWNRIRPAASAEQIAIEAFGDMRSFILGVQFGGIAEHEAGLCARLGLSYDVIHWESRNEATRWRPSLTEEWIDGKPPEPTNILQFLQAPETRPFLEALSSWMASFVAR